MSCTGWRTAAIAWWQQAKKAKKGAQLLNWASPRALEANTNTQKGYWYWASSPEAAAGKREKGLS